MGTLKQNHASAGNRTRAARVAGEHSTTEPPMLTQRGKAGQMFRSHAVTPLTDTPPIYGKSITGQSHVEGQGAPSDGSLPHLDSGVLKCEMP